MSNNFFVSCEIKEKRGNFFVKTDSFKGNIDECVNFLIEKYGARIPTRLERVFSAFDRDNEKRQ